MFFISNFLCQSVLRVSLLSTSILVFFGDQYSCFHLPVGFKSSLSVGFLEYSLSAGFVMVLLLDARLLYPTAPAPYGDGVARVAPQVLRSPQHV